MSEPRSLVVEVRVVAGRETRCGITLSCAAERLVTIAMIDPDAPADTEADSVWTLTEADARDLAAGGLDPAVAYMRGQMKTAGDAGAPMRVLPLLRDDVLDELRAALAAAS